MAALVFITMFTGYILQRDKLSEPRIVMVGPGYGLEINDGRVITALHVAAAMDYSIVYTDEEKDIAIIKTNHTNKCNLSFKSSANDFIFTDTVPKLGESGTPYIIGKEIYGVIIGESSGSGIAAAFDDSIINILKRK